MSEDKPVAPTAEAAVEAEAPPPLPRKRLPRWTKVLLAVAVGLMLAGVILRAWPAEPPAPERDTRAPAARHLVSGEVEPVEEEVESWSGPLFRLGFGFAAGFCVAWALRAVFKLAVVVIGLIVAALVGLQYAGLVAIDWSAIGGHYDSLSAWLSAQAGSVQRFVTGYLPAAGSAGLGLVTGFRRR